MAKKLAKKRGPLVKETRKGQGAKGPGRDVVRDGVRIRKKVRKGKGMDFMVQEWEKGGMDGRYGNCLATSALSDGKGGQWRTREISL